MLPLGTIYLSTYYLKLDATRCFPPGLRDPNANLPSNIAISPLQATYSMTMIPLITLTCFPVCFFLGCVNGKRLTNSVLKFQSSFHRYISDLCMILFTDFFFVEDKCTSEPPTVK